MKTITLILCLFTLSIYGQTRISLTQDLRLATIGDDKGNEAFTVNFNIRAMQYINGTKDFQVYGYGEYEHADLAGGSYNRFAVGFALNFNTIIKDFDFTVLYGINRILRHGNLIPAWDLTGQIGYNLDKNWSVVTSLQQTKRNDIKYQPFVYSWHAGFEYRF